MIFSYASIEAIGTQLPAKRHERFAQQWLAANGNLEKAMGAMKDQLENSQEIDPGHGFDDILDELERLGLIRRENGQILATLRGKRFARDSIFETVFAGFPQKLSPTVSVPTGHRKERLPSTRAWRHGDDPREIDWGASLRNATLRGATAKQIREFDLESWETESPGDGATALLIDISHSMILYGEDRITPAKMVAIGLAEFLRRSHPLDTLDVIAFGNEAWRIPIDSIVELEAGPFQTNTAEGLRLAREILRTRRGSNKRILVITDGKPTCISDKGRLYRNANSLDPRIVQRTLAEGRLCAREGCRISTFMIARDPELVEFVETFTREVRGRAFHTGLDRLGEVVLRDWLAVCGRSRQIPS